MIVISQRVDLSTRIFTGGNNREWTTTTGSGSVLHRSIVRGGIESKAVYCSKSIDGINPTADKSESNLKDKFLANPYVRLMRIDRPIGRCFSVNLMLKENVLISYCFQVPGYFFGPVLGVLDYRPQLAAGQIQ